jgi:hypothetical protein
MFLVMLKVPLLRMLQPGGLLGVPAGHIGFPKLHSALPALIIHIRNEPRVG